MLGNPVRTKDRRSRVWRCALVCLILALLPACAGGHQFDTTPTPIPLTPTAVPTATAIPPTATLTPTPTRTPLAIPTPRRTTWATPVVASRAWQATGDLLAARVGHTATLLADGSVLVAGGYGLDEEGYPNDAIALAERYDPATGTWRTAGRLNEARTQHTATLLADGTVLVVGGIGDLEYRASAEVYDPATDRWRLVDPLAIGRSGHTATPLPDGTVLVIGGEVLPEDERDDEDAVTSAVERFDPRTGTWQAAGALLTARYGHSASLLPTGELLIIGGSVSYDDEDEENPITERFEPTTGQSRPAAALPFDQYEHTATVLPDGTVLVLGDMDQRGQVYDPATDRWRTIGALSLPHGSFTTTRLDSGMLLVLGGYDSDDTAELFATDSGFAWIGAQPSTPRTGHSATLLRDGSVLVVGGYNFASDESDDMILKGVERYIPALDLETPAARTDEYRANFTTWPQTSTNRRITFTADPTGTNYAVALASSPAVAFIPQPGRALHDDFALEVSINVQGEASGGAGVVLRAQGTSTVQTGFIIMVYPGGYYSITRIGEGRQGNVVQPTVWTSALRPYGVNRLRVICEGDTIALAFNDRPVGRYYAAVDAPGLIGLYAQTWEGESLVATFSKLRILPVP